MKVLGVHAYSHDIGACLITERGIKAISEERLNRIKYGNGDFPFMSIKYLFNEAGIKDINEVDLVVTDFLGRGSAKRCLSTLREINYKGEVFVIKHHDAHAASAFFVSPFQDAAILVIDGCGSYVDEVPEGTLKHHLSYISPDLKEVQSTYRGVGNAFSLIKRTYTMPNFQFGLGLLYGFASAYLGFGEMGSGKVMALAAFGKNKNIFKTPFFYEFENDMLGQCNIDPMKYENMERIGKVIFKGIKQRKENEPIKEKHAEIACYVQNETQKAVLKIVKSLFEITQTENLCIAGGFGLNCLTNSLILETTPFRNLFIQPASTDCGIPLGCALYGYHMIKKMPRKFVMKTAFMGIEYKEEEILKTLEKMNNIFYTKPKSIYKRVAKYISEGKIIGWFIGGSEYGPRALGHRSILADPRNPKIKDFLDNKVKFREWFRPYSPSVLEEFSSEYFDIKCKSPFMLFAPKVKLEKKKLIPAVIHVDGTSRIQTVSEEDNPKYYRLIKEFYNITGIPMVLNTSFNVAGEPIVETPEDALKCFLKTSINYLILEDFIVSKSPMK